MMDWNLCHRDFEEFLYFAHMRFLWKGVLIKEKMIKIRVRYFTFVHIFILFSNEDYDILKKVV